MGSAPPAAPRLPTRSALASPHSSPSTSSLSAWSVQGLERRIHLQGLQTTLDYLDAAEELEEGAEDRRLDEKMKAAGIGKKVSGGREVLARIKEYQ